MSITQSIPLADACPEDLAEYVTDHAEIHWKGARPDTQQVESTRARVREVIQFSENRVKTAVIEKLDAEILRLQGEVEKNPNRDSFQRAISIQERAKAIVAAA